MNRTEIIGNLGKDPETRTLDSGSTVCSFSVAVNRRKSDGTTATDWFNVSAFGKTGENCQKFLAKGRKVYVSGRCSARAYIGNDGKAYSSIDIIANSVEFLNSVQTSAPADAADVSTNDRFTAVDDDELPF